jgi:TATA-binding protein-associated factor
MLICFFFSTQSDNQAVETARSSLHASAQRLRDAESKMHGSVLAAAAGAAVGFGALPPKLNPFIQPLMASVRRERDEVLQGRGAASISSMLKLCADRKPSPNDKLLKNITAMVCGDEEETLKAGTTKDVEEEDDAPAKKKKSPAGIVEEDVISDAAIARRGGEAVVRAISSTFGADVFKKLGALENIMVKPITQAPSESAGVAELQTLVDALQMLKVFGPVAHESLQPKVIEMTKAAFAAALYADVAVRKTAASTIATVASTHPERVIGPLLEYIVPQLEQGEAASETAKRSGAVGLASELVKQLGATLAPYCVLLLVPLMGRMSDPDLAIRSAATRAFASLVPLLPLASGKEPPSELTDAQKERSKKDGAFLEALLDNSKIEDFKLPFKCSRTLRPYQQDGVNWLAFLRRFKLHGALADDMGLGKTLQSTCILAATTVERRESGAKTLPHLVICPTTLVGHWAHEIGLYVEPDVLRPLEYQGTPAERDALQKHFDKYDVVILSYESARADAHTLDKFDWCYCVLDEGHAIRNPKSRVTQAVKKVRAEHRLLLSGTPIQNDVVELWSLFDFLMPGFLGTEREFKSTYGIAAARSAAAKKGGGLTEQGALATGALHKQVMPFVMRRTKDQVLKDLPPKIIQDVYVELTETQRKMYDAFESSEAKNEAVAAVESGGSAEGAAQHVFTTLQYLRKLCSHPKLVANDPKKMKKNDPELRSPKFDALKQILLDCGIGVDVEEEKASGESKPNPASGSGHRVLVFSQLKSLLDLVETELFTSQMRDVSWLRLDGGVAPSQRFEVVRKFNADPSIDVLLLTTHVGGLGLNLTSADTVVFLEHDWNPQKDLQAMDRAHRLGQRRTVNVYRILTRGTLEEKIMSLQRFKLDVANAVVNADNASMSAMDTGQMLELFTAEKGAKLDKDGRPVAGAAAAATKGAAAAAAGAASGGLANIVNGLEELWDESQYAEEFSVDDFVSKLQK